MTFFIEHIGWTITMIIALIISGLFIKQLIDEVIWNNRLDEKKQGLRIPKTQVRKGRLPMLISGSVVPAALAVVLLVTGVNAGPVNNQVYAFSSGEDVLAAYQSFAERFDTNQYYGLGLFREGALEADFASDMAPTAEATNDYKTSDGTGSDDYSETNNQVAGVDEMDTVLTDGKYMYIADGNVVKIAIVYTQEDGIDAMEYIGEITLADEFDENECPIHYYINGMYVDEERLVVIGNEYNYYYGECGEYKEEQPVDGDVEEDYIVTDYIWYPYNASTLNVQVFDKENNFNKVSEYDLSGGYVGTRKIDNNLYIVTSDYIPFYLEDINVDDYLPYYLVEEEKVVVEYEDIVYIDEGIQPNNFTTFYGIDLDKENVSMEVILGDGGYNLYVSTENMYLAGTVWTYYETFADELVSTEVNETKTGIIRIAIDGSELSYEAYGKVSGWSLNQFSMDEYEGVLRIATTTGWGEEANNRVFMLDDNLKEIGKLENLGKPNETIQSVRFVGEYGYVVTFEQTDPFYVLDLSNPSAPEILGELEIPGFSSYLQPLGNDYMLGIGFGDSDGGTQGIKISVYDISDKSNPVVFSEVVYDYSEFGYSYTSVTYNHKDLLVNLNKNLIALPFSSYDFNDGEYGYNSGILVFGFDEEEGLYTKGYVQHAFDSSYDVYVYKSKFIEDYFYTVSNNYIKVSTINNPVDILNSIKIDTVE